MSFRSCIHCFSRFFLLFRKYPHSLELRYDEGTATPDCFCPSAATFSTDRTQLQLANGRSLFRRPITVGRPRALVRPSDTLLLGRRFISIDQVSRSSLRRRVSLVTYAYQFVIWTLSPARLTKYRVDANGKRCSPAYRRDKRSCFSFVPLGVLSWRGA